MENRESELAKTETQTGLQEINRSMFPGWVVKSPSFWVISLALFVSGTVAVVEGGMWVALGIYLTNLLAVLWLSKNKKNN